MTSFSLPGADELALRHETPAEVPRTLFGRCDEFIPLSFVLDRADGAADRRYATFL
ncbi:MAG TPA: hypothetical protein HA263_01810 [Methanoregulaceae archaeon]|nr:hypothetical protein [Methanoregulaceae archaeon]